MNHLQEYYPLASFFSAMIITFMAIPAIVRLSLVKKLYDLPDERKLHGRRISALGGIGIFAGIFFSFVFFSAHLPNPALNSIITAIGILFVTGIKDDLFPLVPYKKLLGQILAILIVIVQGNIRIISLYNLFNIYYEMPYWVSVVVSLIFFLLIINSFNFIDGINGLLSGITIVIVGTYSYWFYVMDEPLFMILGLSTCGALVAFLRYNLVKARIFMGDSGSMVLGFIVAILTIFFIQKANEFEPNIFYNIHGMVYAFSVLIIPVFDSIRVVFIRVFIKRRSPFAADRNHIHHVMLDLGLSHLQSTFILVSINVLLVIFSWYLNESGILAKYQLIIIFSTALGLSQIPYFINRWRKKKQLTSKK